MVKLNFVLNLNFIIKLTKENGDRHEVRLREGGQRLERRHRARAEMRKNLSQESTARAIPAIAEFSSFLKGY